MQCRTYKNVVDRDSDGNERVMDVHAFEGYRIDVRWLLLAPLFLAALTWYLLFRQ